MIAQRHVCISLDFELRWGVLETVGADMSKYRNNLEGVYHVIPAMLEQFKIDDVLATWAVVGSLACANWDDWAEYVPPWPDYKRSTLQFNDEMKGGPRDSHLYFAPELVDAIAVSGQELASHTFLHLYMTEEGVTDDDVARDCESVSSIFRDRLDVGPTSFVFPRNQVARLDPLREAGIESWRCNPDVWFWDPNRQTTSVTRVLRYLDGLLPMFNRVDTVADPRHQRASHFIRFELSDRLWDLHLSRVLRDARSMDAHQILHLWWHPHNMGGNPTRALARMKQLLDRLHALPGVTRFVGMDSWRRAGLASA